MRKSILACVAALALLSAVAPSAARAQGGGEGEQAKHAHAEVVARVKNARAKNRRVTIKFKDGADVTGRVGEVRERGFTFEPDGLGPELRRQNAAAVILYENVASVRHPSQVKNFFKKVGYGVGLAGAFVVVAPLNGVTLLLFGSTIPGCP
jgi:hypothetical protein